MIHAFWESGRLVKVDIMWLDQEFYVFKITDNHSDEQPGGRRHNSAELQISQFAAHDSQVALGEFSQLPSHYTFSYQKKKVCLLLRATFTQATAAPFVTANELFMSKLSP